jgi:threonine/homoserine/homoserine lactone efflux protein
MIEYLVRGAGLGFTAGGLPGAPQAYLIGVTVRYGWRLGLLVALAPIVADIPIALVTLLVLVQFPPVAFDVLRIVGGLFMLWIAWGALRGLRAGPAAASPEPPVPRAVFAHMLPIIWLSPGPWLFWATVNTPLLVEAWAVGPLVALAFLAGFYGLLIGLSIAIVLVFDRLRRIDPRLTTALIAVSIGLLIVFGLSVIVQGVRGLFL